MNGNLLATVASLRSLLNTLELQVASADKQLAGVRALLGVPSSVVTTPQAAPSVPSSYSPTSVQTSTASAPAGVLGDLGSTLSGALQATSGLVSAGASVASDIAGAAAAVGAASHPAKNLNQS